MTERTIPIFHPSPFSDGKPNFYPLHIIGFHIKQTIPYLCPKPSNSLICWMFYKGLKFVQSILGNDQYVYFKPLMCQIILMGLTNPIQSTPSNFIMLFFVSPLLIKRCVKQ